MLDYVDIDSRTEGLLSRLFGRTLDDFFYREICMVGMFSMEKGCRYPDLVGDFDLYSRSDRHACL